MLSETLFPEIEIIVETRQFVPEISELCLPSQESEGEREGEERGYKNVESL